MHMQIRYAHITGLFLLFISPALPAQDPSAGSSGKHTPEWTDHKPGDPGITGHDTPSELATKPGIQPVESVVPELERIVVLCAHDLKKTEFDKAWSEYVAAHKLKGKELNQTIRMVISKAVEQRNQTAGLFANEEETKAWRKSRRQQMHQAAKAINDRDQAG